MASSVPTLPNHFQCLRLRENQRASYTNIAGVIANAVRSSVVRVKCTTDAFIKIGVNALATTNDPFINASISEYFRCEPGDKVSAVRDGKNGILYVTEMD